MKMLTAGRLLFIVLYAPLAGKTVEEHPAPGTSIVRWLQLDEGVYKGSRPKTDADFAFLQSLHIKYILNLKFLPFLSGPEKRKAERYGINYLSVYMNASPLPPSEKHVNQVLEILHDPCYQPVYFHCEIGRDRSSLIATMYRIYYSGLSSSDAWQQMKDFGFKDSWTLRGLKDYLLKHPAAPARLPAPSSTCPANLPGESRNAHRTGSNWAGGSQFAAGPRSASDQAAVFSMLSCILTQTIVR